MLDDKFDKRKEICPFTIPNATCPRIVEEQEGRLPTIYVRSQEHRRTAGRSVFTIARAPQVRRLGM